MDILNNIGFDWQVALVNFVNFILIFWILKKFVFPKISEVLSERKKVIEKGLQDSKKAEAKLEEVEIDRKNILKEAKDEASDYMQKTKTFAKEQESEIIEKAKNQASKILESSKNSGVEEKKQIIDSAKEDIAKMIVLGAEKVLAEK